MLKEELVKYFKKALASLQKVKTTSCILPQRNSNSVEKLIRKSFINSRRTIEFLNIHSFLGPFIGTNERYFIRGKYILQHPLLKSPIFSEFSL